MTILLREHDVQILLTMPDALQRVEMALRDYANGGAQNRPRQRVRGAGSMLSVMPASWARGGYMGFKAYAASKSGVRFYFHLLDSNTGEYLAIMEADRLGQQRTGASSGIATKYLARADAKILGVIGAGWQAESQIQAICAVRDISQVNVYSRDEARRTAFLEKMRARVSVPLAAVSNAEAAIREADVVATITSAATPVLQGEWLKAGTHVNAAGSNWASRREVDSETLRRANAIFADSIEDAQIEAGDLIAPISEGVIGWQQVQELSALVAGRATGRTDADAITFFKSSGIALEDVAVASFVYEKARAQNIGQVLPL